MSEQFEVTATDGSKWMLTKAWLRHTQNPDAPKYPKTGDVVKLKKNYSFFLEAGRPYTVEIVEEYEPAYHKDEDGRDIRLTFLECPHKGLNGQAIREQL
jgi:hypothetical protein